MAKRSAEYYEEREHFARVYGLTEQQAGNDATFKYWWPKLRDERRRLVRMGNAEYRRVYGRDPQTPGEKQLALSMGYPIYGQRRNLSPKGLFAKALVEMGWRDESDSWNVGETPKKTKRKSAA